MTLDFGDGKKNVVVFIFALIQWTWSFFKIKDEADQYENTAVAVAVIKDESLQKINDVKNVFGEKKKSIRKTTIKNRKNSYSNYVFATKSNDDHSRLFSHQEFTSHNQIMSNLQSS